MVSRMEPNIQIMTSDFTNSKLLTNTLNTALVIKSSMGITEPQLVTSQVDLLNKYSSKGFISSDDDITFKSAYYLLGFTPLYVCRVSHDSITSGMSNTGKVVYKDMNDQNLHSINSQLVITDSSGGKFDLFYKTAANNVYYCGTPPTIAGTKIKLSANKLTSEEFITLFIANSTESIIYNKTTTEYQFISDHPSEKITDYSPNYLKSSSTNSNFITIEVQPKKSVANVDYIILNNTLYYFDDGQSLPPFSDSKNVINKFSLRAPTNSLQTEIYITYLEQELLTKQTGYNSLIKFRLEFPEEIQVLISSDLSPYISLDRSRHIQSKNAILDSGYIIITREGISNLFYIGETEPDVSSTGLTITGHYQFGKKTVLNRFLMGIYENKVFNNHMHDSFNYTGLKLVTTSLKISASSNAVVYESNLKDDVGSISSSVYAVVGLSLDDYNINNKIINKYYISLDNNIYYVGQQPTVTIPNPVYVKISDSPVLYKDLVNTFMKYMSIDYKSYLDKSKNINLLTNSEVAITYDNTTDLVTTKVQSSISLMDRFAVFSKFTSDRSVLSYSVTTTTDPEIFVLKVSIKAQHYEYNISFNPDKVDGFGTNLYYTRINDINPYIEIVEINPNAKVSTYTSPLFGDEVSSLDVTIDDYLNCLTKFENLEGIKYDLILPGGFPNIRYIKALATFGQKNYTKVITTSPEEKTIDLLIAYKTNLGIDNWWVELLCQWFKTTINNFSVNLPMELLYVERVVANFNAGNEYAAVFGKNTGLATSNPTVIFNKQQREILLGNRIIPIKYDRQNNISYFDDNLNLTNQETYLGNNENFVRVINTMAHVADEIMEQFIARANNSRTQRSVVEKLTAAYTELGLYSNDFVNDILIVCDDSNNTQDIKDQNKLIVTVSIAFNNSIKYILVYQKVVTTIT